ncbi:hypothetical protein C0993_007320, partial [Termitomyces sp. T159_Od127]
DQRSLNGFGFTQKKMEASQVIDIESSSSDDAFEVELSDFQKAELPGLVEMKSAGSDVNMISVHSNDEPKETEIRLDPTDKNTSDIESWEEELHDILTAKPEIQPWSDLQEQIKKDLKKKM